MEGSSFKSALSACPACPTRLFCQFVLYAAVSRSNFWCWFHNMIEVPVRPLASASQDRHAILHPLRHLLVEGAYRLCAIVRALYAGTESRTYTAYALTHLLGDIFFESTWLPQVDAEIYGVSALYRADDWSTWTREITQMTVEYTADTNILLYLDVMRILFC